MLGTTGSEERLPQEENIAMTSIHRACLSFSLLVSLGCETEICEPFTKANLPGITKVGRCDDQTLSGETTASAQELADALSAAGFERGRNKQYTVDGSREFWLFRYEGKFYRLSTEDPVKDPKRDNPFFTIGVETASTVEWIAEDAWQAAIEPEKRRKAVLEQVKMAAEVLRGADELPSSCPSDLEKRDEVLAATARRLLVNSDSVDYRSKEEARGPDTGLATIEVGEQMLLSELLKQTEVVEQIAQRRVVPAIVLKEFVAPEKDKNGKDGGKGRYEEDRGQAVFDVGIVDLETKAVLCGTADVKASIFDGKKGVPMPGTNTLWYVLTPKEADLSRRVRNKAYAELARLAPLFSK